MRNIRKRRMRLTSDLVANHVSKEHRWVIELENGDASMLQRFVTWSDAIKMGKIGEVNVFLHTEGEHAGKLSLVEPSFPENNPDSMWTVNVGGEEHKIFVTFMNPYQLDVDITDPEVFSDHLETLAFFLNNGQLGLRLDAVLHMGKEPGTHNFDLPASRQFVNILKSFANHLAPEHFFVPEVPLPWDKAKDWLEGGNVIDGKKWGVGADAPVGFPAQQAIVLTLLSGDKKEWAKVQEMFGTIAPGTSVVVYMNSHDEIMVTDPVLRQQLLKKGCHDFAGRGVGDSMATLLDGDEDRLAMAHALLYSSKGHPMVYYRTVVGAGNDDKHYQKKKVERAAGLRSAGMEVDMAKASDTRDLNRGPITRDEYERALENGYKPAITVRALNALWDENSAVSSNNVEEVKNPDPGIYSIAHRPGKVKDAPLLQIFNLTSEEKTVELDLSEVKQKIGWSLMEDGQLKDILASKIAGKPVHVGYQVDADSGKLKIALPRYAAFYLK